jgi:hypothetical protein
MRHQATTGCIPWYTPMRYTSMRHTYETHANEVHTHEIHACEIHAHEEHACEMHAHERRKSEAYLLRLAHQRGVEGIAKLIGNRRITSIDEMRSSLTFTKPYFFRSAASATSSLSQSFSQSQPPSVLSGSFNELRGLSIADSASRKRKSVDVDRKPSKRSRSNSQRWSQGQNEVTYDVEVA